MSAGKRPGAKPAEREPIGYTFVTDKGDELRDNAAHVVNLCTATLTEALNGTRYSLLAAVTDSPVRNKSPAPIQAGELPQREDLLRSVRELRQAMRLTMRGRVLPPPP